MLVGLDPSGQRRRIGRVFGRVGSGRAAGFKTKPKDVADPAFLVEEIRRHEAVVIRLRRSDLLRLAISRINARRLRASTGRWNAGDGVAPVQPVSLDPETLRQALEACREEVDRVDALCRGSGRPVLDLDYVDVLRRPEEIVARCQEALGVPVLPLESAVRKNTDENLERAIPNLHELRDRFLGGPWEAVFDVDFSREDSTSAPGREG